MTATTTLVDDYLAAWNATDADARRTLIGRVFTDDATYVDPQAEVAGAAAIDGLIAAVQEQFPGFVFTLAAGPDAHHDRVRFSWHLGPADGAPIALGLDVATVAPDGRLQAVTGFLEPVAAG